MPKGYNSLNNIPVRHLEIGMCPTCCRRLTDEKCTHSIDMEYAEWQAAHFAAEQQLHNETVQEIDREIAAVDEWVCEAEESEISRDRDWLSNTDVTDNKCSKCAGFGWYVDLDKDGETVQVQCEHCQFTGIEPVTVGDLTDAAYGQYFNGEATEFRPYRKANGGDDDLPF